MQILDLYKKIAVAVAVLSLNACALVAHQPTKTTASQAAQSAMADADFHRAVTAAKAGREEDAAKLFTAVTKSHPDFAAAYINLGLIELKRGNLHTAKTALLHAAALAPRQPEVYNGLGIIYRRLGRFADAESAYLKALQLSPDYANAQMNIGILYDIYLNNLSAALDHYQRYEAITGGHDEQVKKWIQDVKLRRAKTMGAAK